VNCTVPWLGVGLHACVLFSIAAVTTQLVVAQEFLAIQNQQPRNVGFFGTRNMGFMHQQLIEVLSYAMLLTVRQPPMIRGGRGGRGGGGGGQAGNPKNGVWERSLLRREGCQCGPACLLLPVSPCTAKGLGAAHPSPAGQPRLHLGGHRHQRGGDSGGAAR
jgi:hypothetical protein